MSIGNPGTICPRHDLRKLIWCATKTGLPKVRLIALKVRRDCVSQPDSDEGASGAGGLFLRVYAGCAPRHARRVRCNEDG